MHLLFYLDTPSPGLKQKLRQSYNTLLTAIHKPMHKLKYIFKTIYIDTIRPY